MPSHNPSAIVANNHIYQPFSHRCVDWVWWWCLVLGAEYYADDTEWRLWYIWIGNMWCLSMVVYGS